MKDVVDFETAVRLKEAGFPQASPEVGQFWYNEDKDLGVLGNCISATFDFTWCSVGDNYDGHDDHYENTDSILKEYVFVPTATDIMRSLWFRFSLKFGGNGKWIILQTKDLNDCEEPITTDANPAEAAAQAWLIDNEK